MQGESRRGKDGSARPEPKGQKYLIKGGRKWDLAAGQSPAFFVRWPTAAGGACEVLIHYTQSRLALLRQIRGHAVTGRTVMCALLYAPPTLAYSFSNSPLGTTLLTPVLCSHTRETLQVQPSTLLPCKTYTLSLSKKCSVLLQSCL